MGTYYYHFYVYGSVHRWSILMTVQRDATQSSLFIILQVHSTCFGCQPHPSSGVHKTVTIASVTVHIFCAATSLQRGRVGEQKIWPVPEAVVTVLCTPDDGCAWHPKHVEWTCRIINRLLCVVSCWTVINILIIIIIIIIIIIVINVSVMYIFFFSYIPLFFVFLLGLYGWVIIIL